MRDSHGATFLYRRHLAGKRQKPIESPIGHDAMIYNRDNKRRSASRYVDPSRTDSIAVKHDPMGSRVYKSSTVDGVTTGRKFIVDISGQLPTILCVADAGNGNSFDTFSGRNRGQNGSL